MFTHKTSTCTSLVQVAGNITRIRIQVTRSNNGCRSSLHWFPWHWEGLCSLGSSPISFNKIQGTGHNLVFASKPFFRSQQSLNLLTLGISFYSGFPFFSIGLLESPNFLLFIGISFLGAVLHALGGHLFPLIHNLNVFL